MTAWNRRMAAATRVREATGSPEAAEARLEELGLPPGLHHDDRQGLIALLRLARSRAAPFSTTMLARVEEPNGQIRELKIVVMGNEQGVTALVGDSEEEIRVDPLTGLPGRDYFLPALADALQHTLNRERSVGVFSIDIDRFKTINDSQGLSAGDRVLMALAAGLESVLRPHDTLCRLGGDEFTVICTELVGLADAMNMAEELRRVCNDAPADSPLAGVTVSIGVATGRADRSSEDLLREAETALYKAKGLGRDRCEVFDEDLRSKSERRITVDQQLRRAIDNDGIQVHYQPIYSVETRQMVGFEALLRIEGPDGEHYNPVEMVEAAEDSGLIRRIEEMVLRSGAATLQRLPDVQGEPLFLSVNVSDRHLTDSRYPLDLARILHDAGLPADQLHLEISRATLDRRGAATRLVTQLAALGVSVVIDEFIGASDSDLVIPEGIDMIKLDKRLVHGVHGDRGRARAELVTSGIIDRGAEVCAVGVETEEDLEAMKKLGCTYAQGYLFSPPLDGAHLASLIRDDAD